MATSKQRGRFRKPAIKRRDTAAKPHAALPKPLARKRKPTAKRTKPMTKRRKRMASATTHELTPVAAENRPVMIQVDVPEGLDPQGSLTQTYASLAKAGVNVDQALSPTRIGARSSRRFVLRGNASQNAIKRARKELAVEIFPDMRIDPLK